MIGLIFKDGTLVQLYTATREELIKWIKEADTLENRTLRKQICFARLHSAGSQTIANLLICPPTKPGSAP